jgi:hypothetical protein
LAPARVNVQATVLRHPHPLLAIALFALGIPAPARAQRATASGPVEPAPPPEAALVPPQPDVAPLAPQATFLPRGSPRQSPEPPSAPLVPPEETREERARERAAIDENWLDAGHAFLAERIFAPVLVFDRFFSDESALDAERSRSFIRWRNELRVERGTTPVYTTNLRADLRFPGVNRMLERLRLVLEGETHDTMAALFPGEGEEVDESLGTGGAELRVRLWEGLLTHGDLGAGLLLELPPGAFVRARLRWAIPVGDLFLTRLSTSGFWRTDTHFGTSIDASLERGIKRAALLRLFGQAQLTQLGPGVEWSTEVAALRAFTRTVAGSVGVGMFGVTYARASVDTYRVVTRLRSDVYRRWLFLELEPEVFWPWRPDGGRDAAYAVTFRVEVQFRGWDADERPEKPPARAEEPPSPAEPAEPTPRPAETDGATG